MELPCNGYMEESTRIEGAWVAKGACDAKEDQ